MKAGCLRKTVFGSAAAKRSGATALLLVSAAYQRDAEATLRPLKAQATLTHSKVLIIRYGR